MESLEMRLKKKNKELELNFEKKLNNFELTNEE
jgi:hypothetical protein